MKRVFSDSRGKDTGQSVRGTIGCILGNASNLSHKGNFGEDGGIEFGNEKKKKIVASNEKVKV